MNLIDNNLKKIIMEASINSLYYEEELIQRHSLSQEIKIGFKPKFIDEVEIPQPLSIGFVCNIDLKENKVSFYVVNVNLGIFPYFVENYEDAKKACLLEMQKICNK